MAPFGPPYELTAAAINSLEIDLSWKNAGYHDTNRIERMISGGQYTEIATVDGNDTSYPDGSVSDGTAYVYRVRAGDLEEYSNEANAITPLPAPSNLSGYVQVDEVDENGEPISFKAVLSWIDNSQNEDGFKVYQDEAVIKTTDPNVTVWTVLGLTPNAKYKFRVRAFNAAAGDSPFSNSLWLTMGDPPKKPTELTATTDGMYNIRTNWKDNSDNELDFHIEHTKEYNPQHQPENFVEVGIVGAGITTYEDLGLTERTQYWYRVRAHNASGYSEYSNIANSWTWDVIAPPSNLVCTAAKVDVSQFGVESVWDDNSSLEDRHDLERKTDAGEGPLGVWEIITHDQTILHPNETYFHDVSARSGNTYTYRIRAFAEDADPQYSGYSNEFTITVPDVPAPPTNLIIAPKYGLSANDYQDTWVRLAWTKTSGEVGYSIEVSETDDPNDFYEIMRICAGVESMKINRYYNVELDAYSELKPSTPYWFRIRAYNATENPNFQVPGGYQDYVYSNVATVTTRAVYLASKFERLIKRSKPRLIFLVEANPLMDLTGWTLKATKFYTYEAAFDEDGAALIAVYENGVALTANASVDDGAEYAGTYWHDIANKKVYIHTTDGLHPVNFLITGSFWIYLTTWQRGSTVYDGNNYLPLVAADGIPDISQTIQPFYKGTFAVSSGTANLINGKIRKAFYFDMRFAKYHWLNRRIKILAGGEDFTYSEFAHINTGSVNSVSIDDHRMSLDLRDLRDGLRGDIPPLKYLYDMFPLMDEKRIGTERPFGFGVITGAQYTEMANKAVPVCINMERRVFEFQAGRVKDVLVTQNGTVLGAGTDYFIDYQRGRITLARDLEYDETSDIIRVNFTGNVNTANEANVTGAEIFLDIYRMWLGCSLADMDLDAIYATKIAHPEALSLYLRKARDSGEVVRIIEQTIQSYTMQDGEGRLGIRAEQPAPASGAPYVWNVHVFDFKAITSQDQLYSEIQISYGEDPSADIYAITQILRPSITWRHGVNKTLPITVALSDVEDALGVGLAIADVMERQQISFTIPRVLYTCLPGDVIYFNRTRFPSLTGTAANIKIKLLGVSKLVSSGKTAITAEVMP